jgi:hypothetical protein
MLWQFWFDRLKRVLVQISGLCPNSPEAVQLSDWMSLTALPGPSRSAKAVQDLFYPAAPTDVLDNPADQGHQHRAKRFLTVLSHRQYHAAYRFVLEHSEEVFLDVQALLLAGRKNEGKSISQVMSQVVQWLNPQPTLVSSRENNKPPLWQDLISPLQAPFGSQAEDQSQRLQRQIFDVVRGRLDDLEGSLEGRVGHDSYLERFSSPIWKEILVTVRATAGPCFQGQLARYNTELPPSLPGEAVPALTRDLSRALCRLPQVRGNPALRATAAVEELIRRLSPMVAEWAAQQCKEALEAQAHGTVPSWPPSILQQVRAEHLGFSELVRAHTPAPPREESGGSATPRQRSPDRVAGLVESVEVPVESAVDLPPSHPPMDVTSSAKELVQNDSVLTSLTLGDAEMRARRKTLRRATGTPNQLGTSWVPLITTTDRVRTPLWASRPAARTNRG